MCIHITYLISLHNDKIFQREEYYMDFMADKNKKESPPEKKKEISSSPDNLRYMF